MRNRFILDSHKRCQGLKVNDIKPVIYLDKINTTLDKKLVNTTGRCIRQIASSFFALYNCFYTLTNSELVVLRCFVNKNSNVDVTKYVPSVGTSLKEEHYGTTAISLASLKKDVSYAIRNEHYRKSSKNLSCVAAPIIFNNKILGYIGLSAVNKGMVTPHFRVFIESLSKIIEHEVSMNYLQDNIIEYIYAANEEFDDNNLLVCLSDKEKQVAHCVLKGYSNNSIAKSLFISETTVKTHLKSIFEKYGVNNRTNMAINMVCNELLEYIGYSDRGGY